MDPVAGNAQDIERVIQEYVPGKQVTLAHMIATPTSELCQKVGVSHAEAISILLAPGETAIIAGDIATKAASVVGATVSYTLMALSHILLRVKHPHMKRPYRTPGGVFTSGIALVLLLVALTGVYAYDERAFYFILALFAIIAAYYFLYSRKHLVAKTAEEELK